MTPAPSTPVTGAAFDSREWLRLLALCAALMFEGMSLSSINVQLFGIRESLSATPDQLQLVAGIFLVSYAGLLLWGGRLADRWGAKPLFLTGCGIFGAASLWAALTPTMGQLIAARAAQGAGAALTAPAAVALIIHSFGEGPARARALGVLSAMGAAGFTLGVLAGGMLTSMLGWRWAFGLFAVLSAAVLAIAPPLLSSPPRHPGGTPWAPAALFTASLIAIVHAIGLIGQGNPVAITLIGGAGLLALAIFFFWQLRTTEPLIPLPMLGDRTLAAACLALGGSFASIIGSMFLIGMALQDQFHYSPWQTGLAFLPQGLVVTLLSTTASGAAAKGSASRVLVLGLGLLVLGALAYITVPGGEYFWRLLPACLLCGAGIALVYPAATLLASSAAGISQQATASGVLTTSQQIGGALGVAAVTAIQNGGGTAQHALSACAAIMALTAVAVGLLLRRRQLPDSRRESRE